MRVFARDGVWVEMTKKEARAYLKDSIQKCYDRIDALRAECEEKIEEEMSEISSLVGRIEDLEDGK